MSLELRISVISSFKTHYIFSSRFNFSLSTVPIKQLIYLFEAVNIFIFLLWLNYENLIKNINCDVIVMRF